MTILMTPNIENTPAKTINIQSVADIYLYLDGLFDQEVDGDTLFASGYLRGFIGLVATDFGDENQDVTAELFNAVTLKLKQAKSELSPQDAVIVSNFWLGLHRLCEIS